MLKNMVLLTLESNNSDSFLVNFYKFSLAKNLNKHIYKNNVIDLKKINGSKNIYNVSKMLKTSLTISLWSSRQFIKKIYYY